MKSKAKLLLTIVLGNFLNFAPPAFTSDEQKESSNKKRSLDFNGASKQGREKRRDALPEIPDFCICGICSEWYDMANHAPLTMSCGHTFGAHCLKSYQHTLSLIGKRLKCPTCRQNPTLPQAADEDVLNMVLAYKRMYEQTPVPLFDRLIGKNKRTLRLVCELYSKYGQQQRCRGNSIWALVAHAWNFKLFDLIKAAGHLNKEDMKTAAWMYSQPAFLSTDLEFPDIDVLFKEALAYFEAQLEFARAEKDEKACKLILLDKLIIQLHYVGYKRMFGRIDFNTAKMELDEIEATLGKSTPRRKAQLKKVQASNFLMARDFENALSYAKESFDMVQNEGGAEICTWTLIRILADEMLHSGVVPSVELLKERYQAAEWKKAAENLRSRAKRQDDVPEMGRPLYDLGRVAISLGLLKEAQGFMNRSFNMGIQITAQIDKYTAEGKFEGLPHGFRPTLPMWARLAKAAADELAGNLVEEQAVAEEDCKAGATLDNAAFLEEQERILLRTRIREIKAQLAQEGEEPIPLADAVFPGDLNGPAEREKAKIRQFFEGI